MKMEEYMKSELSDIFRLKLVAKNIVRRSSGTHFMHIRSKTGTYYFVSHSLDYAILFLDDSVDEESE